MTTVSSAFSAIPDRVIIRLSALGDVALTTGPLKYWYDTCGWQFTVITRESWVPLFEGHPAVTKVIGLTAEDLRMPRILSIFQALAETYCGWELVDLHGTLRTSLLALFWNGPVRRYRKLGFARRMYLLSRGRFFQKTLLRMNVPQRYTCALQSTPPNKEQLLPYIALTPQETLEGDKTAQAISAAQAATRPPVAIHPYATHPGKAWTQTNWHAFLTRLTDSGIPWLILGQGEKFTGIPTGQDLTGKTTLRETCAILQACSVLITGDSGPMHLAAAVGTPVIALFGPTTAAWGFYPAGAYDRVLQHPLSCRPCSLHGKQRCPLNQRCMQQITPDEVCIALKATLAESQN